MCRTTLVAALSLAASTALAAPGAGAPYQHEAAKAEKPGGNHGGIYAEWEYPDFAWTEEGADALAEWLPTPMAIDEPVDWIDWEQAAEIVSERTATTASYILADTGWNVTRAWPAPVHYRDTDGEWQPIQTTLQATSDQAHPWEVWAHQTPMTFPQSLSDGGVAIALFGFFEPLELAHAPRLSEGDGATALDEGTIEVDGARAFWGSEGLQHAIEVTGFGLVQVVHRLDGAPLDAARFEQIISLPPGLEVEVDGTRLRLMDDAGVEQAMVTATARGVDGQGGAALTWTTKSAGRQTELGAEVPSGAIHGDVYSISLQWRLGPDGVRERMGGLQRTTKSHDAPLEPTCLGCAAADLRAGLWAELDWSATELGDGALRAWLDTGELTELADLPIGFTWDRPTSPTKPGRAASNDEATAAIPWSLPANWAAMPSEDAEAARVGSAPQLDTGLGKAVASTGVGTILLQGALSDQALADPFISARLAQMSVTVQTLAAQVFPFYIEEYGGSCHGHACWNDLGWSVHGAHAETGMMSRVADGLAISMPSTAGCTTGTEHVNTWIASPWVTVQDSKAEQAVRWIDDLSLEGDWDTVSAELRLEYRFRDGDWEVSNWTAIPDGPTHGGDPEFASRSEGARDAISFEPGTLPDSVRDVQLRYRVIGYGCIGGLGADPLAAAKAAAAKANIATWGGCNGWCSSSGIQCGSCSCIWGGCYILAASPQNCWPCSGSPTNTGKCRLGKRYCHGGKWSGCSGAICRSGEYCNGVDDNCNGQVDEPWSGGCTWYYYDADGDGWGSYSASCRCSPGGGYTANKAGDCNNWNGSIYPGAAEKCNGADDNCNGSVDEGNGIAGCTTYYKDNDGDGYGSNSSVCTCSPSGNYKVTNSWDCNDGNSGIHPGQSEKCGTWYDDDCDGATNEQNASGCNTYYWDADGDGYGIGSSRCYCSPVGNWRAGSSGDCNDGNSSINPGASEKCNGVDDNCKNGTDEGLGSTTCGQGQCYHTQANCVGGSTQTCNPYQGATAESCDGKDNDCDGKVDENWSLGSACDGSDADQCAEGVYVCNGSGGVTCNDYSGNSVEVCDGSDNDCDGVVDEAGASGCTVYYIDGDNDGYGVPGSSVCTCGPSGSYRSTNTSDCVDSDSAIHPGHSEWCDNKDNDCDGSKDEGYNLGASCDSSDSDSCSDGVIQCAGNTTTRCDGELVFALDFNDGKSDASGNGQWYGLRRGAKHVSNGNTFGGIEFDGQNDYAYVKHHTDLLPTDGITLAMWVNPDAGMNCSGANNWRYLAAKSGWGEYHLIFEQGYSIGWTIRVNGSDQRLWTPGNSTPANQWSHYVATYDLRTGAQRAYVNGALVASRTGPKGSLPNYGGELRFGNWSTQSACRSGSGAYNGRVDDFLFYRRALSSSEIASIYAKEGHATNEPGFGFNKELCDGIDNDCDGATDEGHTTGAACDSSEDDDLCQDNNKSCSETGYGVACREGPIGRWLDGAHDGNTVLDTTGGGLNGTAHNVEFQWEGAYFNGSNAYVNIPGSSALNAPNYTVTLWVKPLNTSTYWTGVFGQHGGGRSMNFWMGGSNGNGPYQVHHTGGVPGNWNFSCNAWGLNKNVWNHVAITHDADGARRTYINGSQVCHATSPGPNTSTGAHQIIMGRNLDGGQSNYFKGWLKDVSLYRYAITPTEVAESYTSDESSSANLELCDKIDNDCDGTTDEGYSLYASCEGGDVDSCLDGTIICDTAGTGTTCRDASPVGFWDFNEGAGTSVDDVADNQNPRRGTFQSDPAFVNGKIGKALQFDGNDAVNIGDHPELDIATREMTMEAWVRSTSSSVYGMILNKDSSYEIAIRSGGKFQCAIKTTDMNWKWRGYTHVNDNQWHHVACVLDTDGMIRTYVDGNLDHAHGPVITTANGKISVSNEQLRIGRRKNGMYFKQGIIDEVAVYDVALTREEIQARASGSEQLTTKNYERCDDRDNDCDSSTDEPFTDKGNPCLLGGCSTGEMVCNATMDATYCMETTGGGAALPESCNGEDDDCDGTVDEDFTYTYKGLTRRVGQACDGFGECGAGTVHCISTTEAACSTNPNGSASQAQAEQCDYLDNDCDKVADDGIAYHGSAVGSGCDGIGACGAGTVECNVSTVTPTCSTNPDGSSSQAVTEICDGQDNDCDGSTDEGYTYLDPVAGVHRVIGQSCYGYGTCGIGIVMCAGPSGANCSTNPGMAADNSKPESCNALDDDCDGATDEAANGSALTQACYTGPGGTQNVGVCVGGLRTCSAGHFGGCIGEVTPGSNDASCDGKDNDCNGAVDENYVSTSCGVGECASTSTCIAGVEKACSPGTPSADNQCDGKDNDCDNSTDEHYVEVSCGKGVCAAKSSCSGGVEKTCTPGSPTLAVEKDNCDNLDNDCDGSTDELYDDGVGCTDSSCSGGVATNTPNHGACNDSQPCTDDSCHPQFDCANVADNQNAPDPGLIDTNPCTTLQCYGGTSQNLPDDSLIPDDGIAGTIDTCSGGVESHVIAEGYCVIDSQTYEEGDVDPSDSCRVCYPDESNTGFSSTILREAFDLEAPDEWELYDFSGSGVQWHRSKARAESPEWSLYMGKPVQQSYAVGARVETWATSPEIWLPDGVVPILSFRLWLETEGFNQAVHYDVLYVDVVRSDGSTTSIWNSVDGVNGSTAGSFRQVTVDLGDFADQTVRLRWRFDSGDELFNDFEGAYIDDVAITTACCASVSDCDDGDDCTIDSCQNARCNYVHTCDVCSPTPVNMLVLLDQSGSMNNLANAGTSQSKWQAATNSLVQVLSTYGPILNTSLKLFKTPGPSPCHVSTDGLELPFHSSSQEFGDYLSPRVPGGLTPMAAGLYGAEAAYAKSGLSGTKYVLLITDGSETCGGDPVKAVEDLYAAGLDVYVVGFGPTGDDGIDHDVLNDMAEAGGHGRDIETAAEAAYYHATSSQELTQVMIDIFGAAAAESCNGVDDDCDGVTDEGVSPIVCNVDCGVWGKAGKRTCVGGEFGECTINPETEVCNDEDDDCNGIVDDQWTDDDGPALGEDCALGIGECRRDGKYVCPLNQITEPICDAIPGQPTPEVCDNLDNNCDGLIDNGLIRDCSTACGPGNEVCIAGQWVNCDAPPVLPDNQCDYIDNDCDGTTDPLYPEIHSECDGIDSDFCAYGTWTCRPAEDGKECINEDPENVVEVCDGATDEDCDGATDEDDAVGCTNQWYDADGDLYGDEGPRCMCKPTDKWTATQGGDCDDDNPNAFPGNPEVCDNVDNDCNGVTDEAPDDITIPMNRACYEGPAGTLNVGICREGIEKCYAGVWSACMDQVMPQTEICNGLDDDCDAVADPDEPDTASGEKKADHPCVADPNCTLGTCYCMENDQTGDWSCILE